LKHLITLFFTFCLLTSPFTLQNAIAADPPAPVAQTGQNICYAASGVAIPCTGTGQDGELEYGVAWPEPRFVPNADKTMTDNLTGLIWSNDSIIVYKDWQSALDYVKNLNSGTGYLGHTDWRLPNINELESLINKGESNNATWLNGQGFSNVHTNSCWSSTTYANGTSNAWYVGMDGGGVDGGNKYANYYVWPVRGGQFGAFGSLALPKTGQTVCYDAGGAIIDCKGTGQDGELQTGATWPITRFVPNADQTITDNLTGLSWSNDGGNLLKNWQGALDYVKNLNSGTGYLGHTDWRLPNINELESLINKGVNNNATWLNGQGFSNVPANYYWSSNTNANNRTYAWVIGIDDGGVGFSGVGYGYGKNWNLNVWPVRGGQRSLGSLTLSVIKSGSGSGTVTSWAGGINCGTVCYANIPIVKTITLTAATPYSGTTFVGWSGPCSGTGVCTVTMDAAKSVTANFTFDPAAINGVCGSSNGATFSSAPTSGLCSTGTPSIVSGTGPWNWSCTGAKGGTTPSCSAQSNLPATDAIIRLPQTGQNICYDAAGTAITCYDTGQDGDLQSGVVWPNPRFTANADKTTLTDNLTGLIWEANPPVVYITWQDALNYIKGLNHSNYLGYSDWRLPNRNELESLVNKGVSNNATWLNGQGFSNVQASFYWTSSTSYASDAWVIVMYDGSVSRYYKALDLKNVWPVRGGQFGVFGSLALPKTGQTVCYDTGGAIIDCKGTGQDGELQTGVAWPTTRFVPNADKTITDNLTGLIWSNDGISVSKTWQGALDYVKALNIGTGYLGHTDWRLPNINELESLIIKGVTHNAYWLDGQGFSNVQGDLYWSSSNITNYPWMVNMGDDGSVFLFGKTFSYYVWPVRGGQSGSLGSLAISKAGTGTGSVSSNPARISCGAICTANFAVGQSIVLTATTDIGSCFASWSGCSSTNANECTVTATRAKSVTATFNTTVPTTYTVTGSVTLGNGTVSCTSPVNSGSSSTCTVTPASGYQIDTFTDNGIDKKGSVVGGSYSITNVTANHTIAATFSLIPPSAVNGTCGSSNGGTFTTAPTTNCCITGTTSTVTGSGPWGWTCTGSNGGTTATCTANYQIGIQTTLKAGWNLMGWTTKEGYYQGAAPLSTEHASSATMSSMQMSDMFGTLGLSSTDSFVIVGPDGVVYIPGSPFNTLKKALPGKAYWIYTPSDKTITVPGTALSPTEQLSLNSGWTQIAYWGTDGVAPENGFNCINNLYDILVDESGKVYMSGSPFNTLKTLQKNKGYFIHTTAPATLVYQCTTSAK
jgi:hypothetical protein